MNKSSGFVGRETVLEELGGFYSERRHVLVVGPAGIGKTALLQHVKQTCPMLLCEEASGLQSICDYLERQLGWTDDELDLIERKNRLLAALERRRQPVIFDQVRAVPPRVARFIGHLTDRIPVWIAGRSDSRKDIGHVWEHLYKFARIEIPPLAKSETSALVENAVAQGTIQPDARRYTAQLHRISRGVPRVLEELLTELAARKYKMDTSFGWDLLKLDRHIRELAQRRTDLSRAQTKNKTQ